MKFLGVWMTREGSFEALGYLPQLIFHDDARSAVDQLQDRYSYGGGWHEFEGFTLEGHETPCSAVLLYPQDPPVVEVGRTYLPLSKETVILFRHAWVAVVAEDGGYRVARID